MSDQAATAAEKAVYVLETMLGCPGACPGCMLPGLTRRDRDPAMSDTVFAQTLDRLEAHLTVHPELTRIEIGFGIGDHLTLPPALLRARYQALAAMLARVDAGGPRDYAFEFTTALFGNEARLLTRLQEILEAAEPHLPIKPIVVIDPALRARAPKQWEIQRRLVAEGRALFGYLAVVINLSAEAATALPFDTLLAELPDLPFSELQVTLVPTEGNRAETLGAIQAVTPWLQAYLTAAQAAGAALGPESQPDLPSALEALWRRLPGDLADPLAAIEAQLIRRLYVTRDGAILPLVEAVGEIPQHPLFGFDPIGRVAEDSFAEAIRRGVPRLLTRRARGTAAAACRSCPVREACAVSGFVTYAPLARAAGRMQDGFCPHVARSLLEATRPTSLAAVAA